MNAGAVVTTCTCFFIKKEDRNQKGQNNCVSTFK